MTDTRTSDRSRRRRWLGAQLVLAAGLAALTMGADRCERVVVGDACKTRDGGVAPECKPKGCTYGGEHYEVGDTFPSEDGCNDCGCNEGGIVACTLKACVDPPKCGDTTCGAGEFCRALQGSCDPSGGTCQPIPQACTAIYAPVCGCDGQTYGSGCVAAISGQSIAHEGECADAGAGGCTYQGKTYKPGEPVPSSDSCNTCTCDKDGRVACTRVLCREPCGGKTGKTCGDGKFCDYPPSANCGKSDASGFCEPIPSACDAIYAPVCGCDGKTYGNSCEAALAQVAIASEGACKPAGGGECKFGDTSFPVGAGVTCPDGCNHCFCSADGGWGTTLIGCPPLPKIELCEPPAQSTEGLLVTPVYLADDALALDIQYGGGCFDHTFKLCYSDAFAESLPVQARLWVVDTTGKVDSCLALPTVQRVFDLGPLREKYEATYPTGPNQLRLNLDRNSIDYRF